MLAVETCNNLTTETASVFPQAEQSQAKSTRRKLSHQFKKLAKTLNQSKVGSSMESIAGKRRRSKSIRKVRFDTNIQTHIIPSIQSSESSIYKGDKAREIAIAINNARSRCRFDDEVVRYAQNLTDYYEQLCLNGTNHNERAADEVRDGVRKGFRGLENYSEVGKYRRHRTETVVRLLVEAQGKIPVECEVVGREMLREYLCEMTRESKTWAYAVAQDDAIAAQEVYSEPVICSEEKPSSFPVNQLSLSTHTALELSDTRIFI